MNIITFHYIVQIIYLQRANLTNFRNTIKE